MVLLKDTIYLEVCDVYVGTLGVSHLDLVLEVLLSGQQVPDLLVVNLQEGGLKVGIILEIKLEIVRPITKQYSVYCYRL